jgi:hypothetical protein
MCMNLARVMMVGRVVVGMRVEERTAQGRSLDGQRERDDENPPHDVQLLVTTPPGVKPRHQARE